MLYLILVATVATLGVASCVEGQVLFSTLPKSLVVTAALPDGKPIGGKRDHLTPHFISSAELQSQAAEPLPKSYVSVFVLLKWTIISYW